MCVCPSSLRWSRRSQPAFFAACLQVRDLDGRRRGAFAFVGLDPVGGAAVLVDVRLATAFAAAGRSDHGDDAGDDGEADHPGGDVADEQALAVRLRSIRLAFLARLAQSFALFLSAVRHAAYPSTARRCRSPFAAEAGGVRHPPHLVQEARQLAGQPLRPDAPLEKRARPRPGGRCGSSSASMPESLKGCTRIALVADDQGRLRDLAPLLAMRRRLAEQKALEHGHRRPGPAPGDVEAEIEQVGGAGDQRPRSARSPRRRAGRPAARAGSARRTRRRPPARCRGPASP